MTNGKSSQFELWLIYIEHLKLEVDPLRMRATELLNHTVGYAQLGLRSILLLNGGGLLAMPTFAQAFGSVWSQGWWLPIIAMGSFTLGLLAAVGAVVYSFFSFFRSQTTNLLHIERVTAWITGQYNSFLTGTPSSKPMPGPSAKEDRLNRSRDRYNFRAIVLGLLSYALFAFGAFVGAYIIAGGEPNTALTNTSSG